MKLHRERKLLVNGSMKDILILLHNKQTKKNFWDEIPLYFVNPQSYYNDGLLIVDTQKLLDYNYTTVFSSMKRLLGLGYVSTTEGKRTNYVLTELGFKEAVKTIKMFKIGEEK